MYIIWHSHIVGYAYWIVFKSSQVLHEVQAALLLLKQIKEGILNKEMLKNYIKFFIICNKYDQWWNKVTMLQKHVWKTYVGLLYIKPKLKFLSK